MTNPNQPVCSYAATKHRNGRASREFGFCACRARLGRAKIAAWHPAAAGQWRFLATHVKQRRPIEASVGSEVFRERFGEVAALAVSNRGAVRPGCRRDARRDKRQVRTPAPLHGPVPLKVHRTGFAGAVVGFTYLGGFSRTRRSMKNSIIRSRLTDVCPWSGPT